MAGRRRAPEVNRREHHAAQVANGSTRKRQLLAMGHWLAALADDRGPAELETSVQVVWNRITELDPQAQTALEVAQQ